MSADAPERRYRPNDAGVTGHAHRPLLGLKLASHYLGVERVLELAMRAEQLGYDSVRATEGRMAPDAVTGHRRDRGAHEQVRVGTSVLNPFTRSPALIAISAATIDRISQGRFILGIGAGDQALIERQHIPYNRPLTRLRECVAVVRELRAGGRVDQRQRHQRDRPGHGLRAARREGSGLRRGHRPPGAATGGCDRDAILLNVCVPRTGGPADAAVGRCEGGRQRGRRHGAGPAGGNARSRAADRGLPHPVSRRRAVSGVPEALVSHLREAIATSLDQACALLPERYVHQLAAVGSPDDCRRWIRRYAKGMDEILVTPARTAMPL